MPSPLTQVLEEDRRLSESLIWPMIEAYYGNAGPDAWKETPYYPTNNAYVAEAYAELILAYLEDALPLLDPAAPVYILELACGSGVLPFLTLKAIEQKWPARPHLHALKLTYVMTDFTQRTLDAWEKEALWGEWVQQGKVDFALFWPERDREIHLRRSGVTLEPGTLRNPPVVVANYFFDSIRHDYFQTDRGSLKEARVKVLRTVVDPAARAEPAKLAEITLKDRYVPVKGPAYPEPAFNDLLAYLVKALERGSFLFPVAPLRCLDNLRTLADGRLFLISSDKGFNQMAFMQGHHPVPYTPHTGSFSYMMNYLILGVYLQRLGGSAWHAPEHPPLCSFAGTTFALPAKRCLDRAVEQVFVARHLPKSGYQISVLLDHHLPAAHFPPLEQFRSLLTCVRLACFDPWVFSRCGTGLHDSYSEDEYGCRQDLRETLDEVERRLHPLGVGTPEAGRHLRRLHFLQNNFERCLKINAQLQTWYGEERDTHYYLGAIHEKRGERTAALNAFRKALHLDPESEHSRDAILRLGGKLEPRPGISF